jgi:hypothetical protein
MMSNEKAQNNKRIGRIYYQALTDAAGYPNGMPYWPEMKPEHKYYHTVTALDFIRMMEKEGYITINKPLGFEDGSVWGEGDCKALIDAFTETHQIELDEFEKKIRQLNGDSK